MKKTNTFVFAVTFLLLFFAKTAESSVPVLFTDSSNQNAGIIAKDLQAQERMKQMRAFTNMSAKDYEMKTGKKLNRLEKFSFRLTQNRMKQMLSKNGLYDDFTTWEKISWFLRGVLLGPLAILLGYIFLKDENRELIKWIWFGSILWVLIFAVYLLSIFV